MSFSRRAFMASAAGFAFAGYARLARAQEADLDALSYRNEVPGYGPLIEDPNKVLDLPEGFSYRVISQAGETMDDGFYVPFKADGMGCIPMGGDRVALIRNHELRATDVNYGPLGVAQQLTPARLPKDRVYDWTDDGRPLGGGTTTLIYDVRRQKLERQHLSLTGTAINCAGGVTPWGSWLTCEETVLAAGNGVGKDHGWVFEVPASAKGLVDPRPIKAMGRFKHEAACVDPRTGIVYLTEDESADQKGLFYRYLPNVPGKLHEGGRLQALAFRDAPEGGDSRNHGEALWRQGDWKDVFWVDLDGVENPDEDLRFRGHAKGGVWFARGEGIHFGDGELYFTCTSGGASGAGQIMRYVPSPHEGQPGEKDAPGRLQLFVEPQDPKVLDYGDNLTIAPWGHLLICEDRYSDTEPNHLRGITPEGKVYTIARNVFRENAELAGACFSPDGSTLFINIYWPGFTLAITGPWNRFQG